MKKRMIALLMTAVLSLQPCFVTNAADFSDNIDISDDIDVSEEMGEVQPDSDIEENWNEENSQFEADEIAEDDIYSEDKIEDQNNPEIEAFGIDNEDDGEENDNEPVTFADEVNSRDGIYVGILNQVYWSQSESENVALMIDGHKYYVTNNVNLIIDRFVGEQVVYTLANGKIDNIEPVTELLQLSVSVNATPDSFVYQNGSYSTDKITVTVNILCIYQTYSQYFGASKYTKEELEKIADLSVPVKQIDLKIGDHLNFGTTGMIFKKRNYRSFRKKDIVVSEKSYFL